MKPLHITPDIKYNNYGYEKIYKLVTHSQNRSYLQYFQYTNIAVLLLCYLKKSNYFQIDANYECIDDDETFIGELLLKNLQILQFNAHEIFELYTVDNDNFHGESVFIGGGLYPTLSLFNHSCDPGIVR